MALLETDKISRRFPGVLALDDVSFAAERGEVHAVCGANGAGKSTLMNILSGTIRPSSGGIRLDGKPVSFSSPAEARTHGVSIVYQEFSSIPELTVADNVFLGREFRGPFGTVDRRRARAETQRLLDSYGMALDPDRLVTSLSVADRQLVELCRALATDAQILILDEPTAVLSIAEHQKLFAVIRRLREQGLLILYISHRLEEIYEIADRVSVMRDGQLVTTSAIADLPPDQLVRLMTGRDLAKASPPVWTPTGAAPPLSITGLAESGEPIIVRAGEVLGLAGLVGAGRTSIARRIAGLLPRNGFTVELAGAPLATDPRRVLASGVFYLTEDRKRDGIFGPIPLIGNASTAALDEVSAGGLLNLRRERRMVGELLTQLRLVAASLDVPIETLSGGNQQKVLFARALLSRPKVLICDEPTRGVDVGAKEEIYAILRRLSSQGVAIILISSELNEVLALSHRIAIVRHGRVHGILDNSGLDEHALLVAATGAQGRPEAVH